MTPQFAIPLHNLTPLLGEVRSQWFELVLGHCMQLFLFRFSLKRREQDDAFQRAPVEGGKYNREMWLREIFSTDFKFTHRSGEIFFVAEDPKKIGLPEHLIVGWLARDKKVAERTAPWDGLDPTEHMSWQASLFLMDPSDHNDGQKVAFEYRIDVAQPEPVMASLASHFDDGDPSEPFSITAFPITQSRSFSKFSEQNVGNITSITYDVAVPNMFNNPGDFTDEMKALRDKGNVSRVKTELKSDGAIDTSGSNLDEIANHVEQGGGKITAKTKDGQKYNSDDYLVSEEIDTEKAEPETKPFWQKISDSLDRIF